MENIVWIFGALIAVWGIIIVILPDWMKASIQFISRGRLVYLAISGKVIFGLVLLIFARGCRIPLVIIIIGLLSAGGSLLFCGLPFVKIKAYLQWWLARPLWLYRLWGVLAAGFGGLMMYAGVPKPGEQALMQAFRFFFA